MIHTLTLNPALDKTVVIPDFQVDTVNRIVSLRLDPGGKGINVSKVIQKMGGVSQATALLGGSTGQQIRDMLEQQGIIIDCVKAAGQTRTNLKIIDPQRKTNTDINEPGCTLSPEQNADIFSRFLRKVQPGDIVVLAGSVPAGSPDDLYAQYVIACRQLGVKVFLDADGALFAKGVQACPYLIKPNLDELSRLVGHSLKSPEDIKAAAIPLVKSGIRKIVVSMGGQGAMYVTKEICLYAPALSVPVGSTVGAGDSVVAALALAEELQLSAEKSLALAVAAGAANVMCSGTQAADMKQVQTLLPKVQCRFV